MDIENVFLNQEEFAEIGEYHYYDGTVVIVNGIFDNDYIEADVNASARIQTLNPRFLISTRKLPKATKQNDFIIIRGKNYRVVERHDDGTGITDLYLQHNSHNEYPHG